jgi:hypothetical protein
MLNKDSTDGILFPKKNVQKYLIINSIIGPRKSGKTTLIKSVIEYFTKIKKWDNSNIISLSSKEGNLKIFVENVSNIFSSINCIKFSDTIISVIDGFFGLELETFETITLSKNSDLKKIIFILTHLDLFKTWKTLKKAKKRIKDRLIKETNGQCKIFYFNGLRNNNSYFSAEIKNLTRYLNKIQSLSSLVRKTQDFGVISKIEFQYSEKKNFAILTGYFPYNMVFSNKCKKCFIPGIGKAEILDTEKNFFYSELPLNYLRKERQEFKLRFIENYDYSDKKEKNFLVLYKNKSIIGFFLFINSFKYSKAKTNHKISNMPLIDSRKLFTFSSSPENGQVTERLISIFTNIHRTRKSSFIEKNNKNSFLPKNFSKNSLEFYPARMIKFCFRLSGLPSPLKWHYDACSLLILLFINQKKRKLTIAKINKNKWEKKNLLSGQYYLVSIGWKLFLTKLHFCNQKNNQDFYVTNNLNSKEFSYICLFVDDENLKNQVVGIKTKIQTRNIVKQGTSSSFLFIGETLYLKDTIKMFKRIKIKGFIFKQYKNTAFIKSLFSSSIEAIKFKDAILKTSEGIRGIIKNVDRNNSYGIIRATFEKKTHKKTSVSLLAFETVKIYKNSHQIFFQLIPIDQQELLY